MNNSIYFDNNSTTKIDDQVLESMVEFMKDKFGNPSCFHSKGIESETAISISRGQVSNLLGVNHSNIYFTSSATESNNWVIRSVVEEFNYPHIITSKIEHPSIIEPIQYFKSRNKCSVTYLDVDCNGRVSVKDFEKSIKSDTRFVTIMSANNEIGTIQPIGEICRLCKVDKNILFHTDATQIIGKSNFDVYKEIDFLSLSSHKLYGPKGVGALYVRDLNSIHPIIYGGGQENKYRSGTENVPGIVGFGKACFVLKECSGQYIQNCEDCKSYLEIYIKDLLRKKGVEFEINTPSFPISTLPNTFNFSLPNFNIRELLDFMDFNNIYISGGSACSSRKPKPSYVVQAIGKSNEIASTTVRISFGKDNNKNEIIYFLEKLEEFVNKYKGKLNK